MQEGPIGTFGVRLIVLEPPTPPQLPQVGRNHQEKWNKSSAISS